MLNERFNMADSLIVAGEKWKENVKGEITVPELRKFETVLNEKQQKYISDNIREINF